MLSQAWCPSHNSVVIVRALGPVQTDKAGDDILDGNGEMLDIPSTRHTQILDTNVSKKLHTCVVTEILFNFLCSCLVIKQYSGRCPAKK